MKKICFLLLMMLCCHINAQTPCKDSGLVCHELKRQRDGRGSLGRSYLQEKCGLNYTAASVRLGQRFIPAGSSQPASFVISGIPLGASIEKAFLWSGTSGNGVPLTVTIQNPVLNSSSFPMTLIGSGVDKCWSSSGYAGSHSYRAVVTSIISGNGTYLISGLPTGIPNDTDGATLLIIYSDPSATYSGTISISDGSIVVIGGSANNSVSYPPPSSNATFAAAFSVVADIQNTYSSFNHSGVNAPYNSVNNWWTFSQSAPNIIAGQTTSNFSWNSPGDCVNWLMAGVYFQTPDCSKFCCPGKNLVVNGDFEGSSLPTSAYTYNSSVAPGATLPGQYNIVNSSEAMTISPGWIVSDPTNCPGNTTGNFMVVNGATCGGRKVVWEQSFTLKDWECYEFCASAKNLRECDSSAFYIKPKLDIEFSISGIGNISQTLNVAPGNCNWFNFTKQVCLWGWGSNLTIKIFLDESIPGDGNDLALDNIALIPIPKCPPPIFSITTGSFFPSYYNITATNTPTANCPATWWEVCEYDLSLPGCVSASIVTNPPAWWFASTSFPGYNGIPPYVPQPLTGMPPGQFAYGKLYRITLGTWGDCHGWGASTQYVGYKLKNKSLKIFTEEEVKKNPKAVLQALK